MKGINTFTLKCIAIGSMLIDHMGAVLFPQAEWMRVIGRLAFPIFAYLLVEGFVYTKDVKKYMLRLGIFALVSEIPFDLAFFGSFLNLGHQNVFFTLFLGVLMMYLIQKAPTSMRQAIIIFVTMLIADYLCTDYGSWGILMIIAFYEFREKKVVKLILIVLLNFLMWRMGYLTQQFAGLSVILIALHNRELGPKMKLVFYAFYPVHLLVLYMISLLMG